MRWFGWAGFLMMVPDRFRMARVSGNARRGKFALADEQQPRLEMTWATVYKRRFHADHFLRRRLVKAFPKHLRKNVEPQIRMVTHAGWTPLLRCRDESRDIWRYAGYCPATERVIELAYHQNQSREDASFVDQTIPSLIDQPLGQPTRWAMFDLSFLTPSGMRYDGSVLHIGDMAVRVTARDGELRGPHVTVRQIYPAELALQRQPMGKWMQTVLTAKRSHYRLRRALGKKGESQFEPVTTARGQGVYYQAGLRWALRAVLWRAPRRLATWLIHEQATDRLLCIQIAGPQEQQQSTLDQVLRGLHWADTNRYNS